MTTPVNLYDVSDKFIEFLETLPQEGKILELTNNFKAFYNSLYEIELEYYENKSLEDSEVNKRLLYEKIVNEFSDFKPKDLMEAYGEPKQEIPNPINNIREKVEELRKQETLEEAGVIKRTKLYNSILSIVKQIPRKEVEGDVMDASSCTYELEQLFLKLQQEQNKNLYTEKEVLDLLNEHHKAVIREEYHDGMLNDKEWFEQNKKK